MEYHYKSAFVPNEDIGTLVKALWLILKTCFHPGSSYSTKDLNYIYKMLRRFFNNTTHHYETYVALCESIMLLAWPWQSCKPGTAFILLIACLNGSNRRRFRNCPFRHSSLLKERQTNPLHRIEWKYLADAVLLCLENPDNNDMAYLSKWFRDNQCSYELDVYLGVLRECESKNRTP